MLSVYPFAHMQHTHTHHPLYPQVEKRKKHLAQKRGWHLHVGDCVVFMGICICMGTMWGQCVYWIQWVYAVGSGVGIWIRV